MRSQCVVMETKRGFFPVALPRCTNTDHAKVERPAPQMRNKRLFHHKLCQMQI